MATSTVFAIAARTACRSRILTLRGCIGVNKISAKIILPASGSLSLCVKQKNEFHTSSIVKKQTFELPKNRKDGAQHWAVERAVAVGLLALIPAGVFYPAPIIDYSLAVLLPIHAYWGINAIVADYMWRPAVPITKAVWLVTSVLAGAGLIYLNMYDVGICKFTAMLLNL